MVPDHRISSDVAASCLGEMSRIARAGAIPIPAPTTLEVEQVELDRFRLVARTYRSLWLAAQGTGLVAAYVTIQEHAGALLVASWLGATIVSSFAWARWRAAASEIRRAELPSARALR